mgnify:FL=1
MDNKVSIFKKKKREFQKKSDIDCYLIRKNNCIYLKSENIKNINQNQAETNFDIIDNLSNFKNKLIKKWFIKNNHNLSLYKLDASLPLSNFSVKGRIYKNNDTLLIIGM